jgi:putative ABC transport system substrate-binding protein
MTAKVATAATRTTPIVAVFIGDPFAGGFVTSLSRPGGNITGVSNLNAVIEGETGDRSRGCLAQPQQCDRTEPAKGVEEAARTIGLKVQFLKASDDAEFEAAFRFIADNRIPALLVPADAFFAAARGQACRAGGANWRPCDLLIAGSRHCRWAHELRKQLA